MRRVEYWNDNIKVYFKHENKLEISETIEKLNQKITDPSNFLIQYLFQHLRLRNRDGETFESIIKKDVSEYLVRKKATNQIMRFNDMGFEEYMMFICYMIRSDLRPELNRNTGGKKSKKLPKKEILGKLRCIYKIPGDRKEYLKHKGKLITVKKYKELMKAKSKKVKDKKTKPKKKELMKAKSKK